MGKTSTSDELGRATGSGRLPWAIVPAPLPAQLVRALGGPGVAVRPIVETPVASGIGAATGGVSIVRVERASATGVEQQTVVRKRLQPLRSGRHAAGADDPRHWAYWRREAEAFASDLLPAGPHLHAPRCLALDGDDLYLEFVLGSTPTIDAAAQALASWQRPFDPTLDRPWIAQDQLEHRLAVSHLSWDGLAVDPRIVAIWEARAELLARLRALPRLLSHGDFSIGNLLATERGIVALDWATLGWEPAGFDLGHLALSVLDDPTPAFLAQAPALVDPDTLRSGVRLTVALVGASRVHWMRSRGVTMPDGYVDFVAAMHQEHMEG
jgi:hypothetical protein